MSSSSSYRTTTISVPSTSVAVAYAAAAASSTTAIIGAASTFSATERLLAENNLASADLASLPHATALSSLAPSSKLTSALVPAASMVQLIATLRDGVRQKRPLVVHVATETADDISNVLAVRDSGCILLRSLASRQQAVDYATAAALLAQKLATPVVHCFPAEASTGDVAVYEAGQEAFTEFLGSDADGSAAIDRALGLFGGAAVEYVGQPDASLVYAVFGASDAVRQAVESDASVGALLISAVRPLDVDAVLGALPQTAALVVAFEQATRQPTPWGPLLFDLATALHADQWDAAQGGRARPVLLDAVSTAAPSAFTPAQVARVTAHARTLELPAHFDPAEIAGVSAAAATVQAELDELSLEEQQQRVAQIPYGQLLQQLFDRRLHVANAAESTSIWGDGGQAGSTPEFGFGKLAVYEQERARLVQAVTAALRDVSVPLSAKLQAELTAWLGGRDDASVASEAAAARITALLDAEQAASDALVELRRLAAFFALRSNWLVGADAWAYDVGSSGVHHVLASGLNINMLVLETTPYPFTASSKHQQRKKDIALYAMNYGTAYVASVAVYASYTQVLQALAEADAYPGPAVVVAYLPHTDGVFSRNYSPIAVLQQSKRAVDSGAWPLFRWNPEASDDARFQLDSERLRRELDDFLRRDNALAAIGRAAPALSGGVDASVEGEVADKLARRARGDVDALLGGLSGPPLLVLFASDGGNAEEVARRVARQGRVRGMRVQCLAMDDYEFDELAFEKTVVLSVSTAGQGEMPTNGREFHKALQAASINLSETQFAVFGLGDSHYWPRAEDALFYNKPGRDLDRKLAELGARRITDAGLGDDQDADGWETGYADFDQRLWAALNIAVVDGAQAAAADEAPARTDEENKVISNFLRGSIAQAIADDSTGAVDEWDGKLLKFHGTYMQDDRDVRAERLARGDEKAYSFMIRVRLPGGVASSAQWLAMDRLADEYGNGTMKITTRQTFQLHGVLKRNLRETMRGINRALMDTIAACGDVNRNVVASANPLQAHLQPEVAALATRISEHLLPSTSAYHEIWLDSTFVAGAAKQPSSADDAEPLYGEAYLPRKFKIAIAIPPENDVDVVAYDLGFIAVLDDAQPPAIVGYNVAIGGGMGMTHNNKKTYPRLASVIGYVPKHRAVEVAEQVMLVQRDHGDRTNRKHARLKYTVDDHGLAWWREQVEQRLGYALEDARPYSFARNGDRYGWVQTTPGLNNFTMFVQNGRVADFPGNPLKTALAEVAREHAPGFRLTCNGHVIVADVPDADVPRISALLAKHRLDNLDYSALRLHSMACAALPTCALAMAESERDLPRLIDLLDRVIDDAGLRNDAIVIRMTGCPNGCARPYNAEIAFVGKAPGAYNLYLGGSHSGERLNKIYRETVNEEQILELLTPIIKQYALERTDGERFGDFVIRKGIVKETIEGKDFHDV
ncbi:Sulfite reductase [NADPH] subunit beta [Coemansia erecta]|uniref:assimilatory sulfite reductase (NADPH) n=1 Tax=Coemansia erecta TaxID=147472 RepID=A0A9W8CTH9_9FUNG|nr:Sulfite reductase [NADPH] subunit beta [Coemansia erecta]